MSWISTEGRSTVRCVPSPARRKDGSDILGKLNIVSAWLQKS
jgi:hypothetical protein